MLNYNLFFKSEIQFNVLLNMGPLSFPDCFNSDFLGGSFLTFLFIRVRSLNWDPLSIGSGVHLFSYCIIFWGLTFGCCVVNGYLEAAWDDVKTTADSVSRLIFHRHALSEFFGRITKWPLLSSPHAAISQILFKATLAEPTDGPAPDWWDVESAAREPACPNDTRQKSAGKKGSFVSRPAALITWWVS